MNHVPDVPIIMALGHIISENVCSGENDYVFLLDIFLINIFKVIEFIFCPVITWNFFFLNTKGIFWYFITRFMLIRRCPLDVVLENILKILCCQHWKAVKPLLMILGKLFIFCNVVWRITANTCLGFFPLFSIL